MRSGRRTGRSIAAPVVPARVRDGALGLTSHQAPNQREYYRHLFRDMVYAALVD